MYHYSIMKINFDWILITNELFDTSFSRYQLPLVTGTHIQQGTNFSTLPIWWLSFSIQQNINDYLFHEVPLLDTQTYTSRTPVISDGPLPCTLQPHVSSSVQKLHHVPLAESFPFSPILNLFLQESPQKKYFFPLQWQVIPSPLLAARWSADHRCAWYSSHYFLTYTEFYFSTAMT